MIGNKLRTHLSQLVVQVVGRQKVNIDIQGMSRRNGLQSGIAQAIDGVIGRIHIILDDRYGNARQVTCRHLPGNDLLHLFLVAATANGNGNATLPSLTMLVQEPQAVGRGLCHQGNVDLIGMRQALTRRGVTIGSDKFGK